MSSDIQTQLTEAEKSFKKACEQIVQLNRRLDEMAKRYEKASRENHRSFRYSLRLRMAVTEGVRNMYYEYAATKADDITYLRCQVLREARGGNQTSREGVEGANVVGEEGSGVSNASIAHLDGVGDILDNHNGMLNDSSASYSALQEEDDDSTSDMQEDSVLDQDNESNDAELPVLSPNDTEGEEIMEAVMSAVQVSQQLVRLASSVVGSASSEGANSTSSSTVESS